MSAGGYHSLAISLQKRWVCSKAAVDISASRVLNSIWSRGFLLVTPALFIRLHPRRLFHFRFNSTLRNKICHRHQMPRVRPYKLFCGTFSRQDKGERRSSPSGYPDSPFFPLHVCQRSIRGFSGKSLPDLLDERGRQIVSILFLIALLSQWIFHLILAAC